MDYYLNKSVSKQFEAFATGFHRVCGGRVLVSALLFRGFIWVGLGWVGLGLGLGVGGWGRFGSVVCFMSFTFHFLQEFFHPEELMQMVVGCQDYDFRDLEEV